MNQVGQVQQDSARDTQQACWRMEVHYALAQSTTHHSLYIPCHRKHHMDDGYALGSVSLRY